MLKKKTILLSLLGSLVLTGKTLAQEAPSIDDKVDIGLSLNHDAFFGFNPMMAISYSLNESEALTF